MFDQFTEDAALAVQANISFPVFDNSILLNVFILYNYITAHHAKSGV